MSSMDDKSIVSRINDCINQTLSVTETWRAREVNENFAMMEGELQQWAAKDIQTKQSDGTPYLSVNKILPVVNSIVGFEIQNRMESQYNPRLINEKQLGYNECLNRGKKYIEENTGADHQKTLAFRDMLICGVGATDTYLSYDNNPDGEAVVERVFPGFLFWDVAARAKNLTDANWVLRLKFADSETLKQEYGVTDFNNMLESTLDARVMQYFQTVLFGKQLATVCEFQWRERKPFYRIENPIKKIDLESLSPEAQQVVAGYMQALGEQYKFNPLLDNFFSVEKEDTSSLKEQFEALSLPYKQLRQKKFKYYRALTAGDKVLDKEENFSQTGFSLKFMTGDYSELLQMYYGVVRHGKQPQKLLNNAVSDFQGFLNSVPKGGVMIEADAVNDMGAFVNTYTKQRYVTVVETGAISGGKIMPKPTTPAPQGLFEMIGYYNNAIMEACGVTPELMGIMSSKDLTATLQRQLVRQSMTTLASFYDAKKQYEQSQAKLYIDVLRVLIENNEGRMVEHIMGDRSLESLDMLLSAVNAEYDVQISEMPESHDEKQANFEKLLQMQSTLAPQGINIMPIVMQYAPFDEDTKEQIKQLMAPPPPAQPDPVMQDLMQSEADYKKSQAQKNVSESKKTEIEVLKEVIELQSYDELKQAQIDKILSEIQVNLTKSMRM